MMNEMNNVIINENNILSDAYSLNETLLNERVEAIDKISTCVINVNELFTDLALIVTEHGSHLDNIEHNINIAATNIEKGKNVIVKIDKKDKKKGKCLCNTIYVCLIINFLIITVLIIKLLNY